MQAGCEAKNWILVDSSAMNSNYEHSSVVFISLAFEMNESQLKIIKISLPITFSVYDK